MALDGGFRIGHWRVEPRLNTVFRNGTSVHLEPKIMEVLVCLAGHAGEPVPKEKLLQAVWSDTFVTDDVLKRSISELRRVFEDDARDPHVIQTVAKRGYRLLALVQPVNGSAAETSLEAQPLDSVPGSAAKQRHLLWVGALSVGTVALLLSLVSFNVGGLREGLFASSSPTPIQSLAVLPLINLSGDPGQEYFADGMTEELITELSRLSGIKVISRTSVMRYKNSNKSLPEIARELHVDGIVEGSVMRSADRVRVTAQLIYARTDANLWAETFDRDAGDVLVMQAAVAGAIASKIKVGMLPAAAGQLKIPRPVNLKAHEAYLRGWHEWDIGGTLANRQGMQEAAEEHMRRAHEYYNEAIREDPGFAPAYLGLANSEPDSIFESHVRKALEIDDSLSDAHLMLGSIKLIRDRNWQDAEREIVRAIDLNPSNAAAHQGYAYFLDAAGRLDEGMREHERAQELDPASDHLAPALYSRRQFDRLIELERDGFAREPERSPYETAVSHKTLMVAYARTGKQKESIEEFRQALIAYGYVELAEDLRRGYARAGYQGALREWLKGVQRQKPEFPFPWVAAYVHAELGDNDAAFAWLLQMKDEPLWWDDARVMPNLVTLRIEPMWDPLHTDPRFDSLVRSVSFPQ
jgi:TolB-like protein/DNA-binding winged helix-turn-helix (wHTH) protein/tetratricopeptide (TPR) repeat protein